MTQIPPEAAIAKSLSGPASSVSPPASATLTGSGRVTSVSSAAGVVSVVDVEDEVPPGFGAVSGSSAPQPAASTATTARAVAPASPGDLITPLERTSSAGRRRFRAVWTSQENGPVDPVVIALTFGAIFVVELPDKTFLATLVLSTRYRPILVWIGVGLAFAVQTTVAVALGKAASLLPETAVHLLSLAMFLAGAVILFREGRSHHLADEDEFATKARDVSGWRAVLASFVVLFAAEWGDLSQLLTLTLVARYDDPVSVFIGALGALLAVSGLAVTRGPDAAALGLAARPALRRGRRLPAARGHNGSGARPLVGYGPLRRIHRPGRAAHHERRHVRPPARRLVAHPGEDRRGQGLPAAVG